MTNAAMLKIDRNAFLALALGMSVGGCYVNANPPPGPRPQYAPAQPPPGGPQVAPTQECVGWTPTGECNQWEAMAAPQAECVGWTPTGECNQWAPMAPTQECVGWTPTGECNRWEPSHE